MLPNSEEIERIDPRVKRTRRLIEHTFTQLLEEKGFSAITVQDITTHAEINRATFYAHYPDKFALFQNILQQMFRDELDRRTLKTCTYSLVNLHALMVTVCEFIAKSSNKCKGTDPQMESLVETQVRVQVEGLLDHWVSQIDGDEENAWSQKSRSTAATWAMYGLAQEWAKSRSSQKLPVEQYAHQLLHIIQANLLAKDAISHLA